MAPLDTTIRQSGPADQAQAGPWSGFIDPDNPPVGSTVVETDEDGGVTVRRVEAPRPDIPPIDEFEQNLAERPELEGSLAEIAYDLMDGIDSDERSRQRFIDNYTRGLELLGLNIEEQSRTKGQKRKTSAVRDTTLLESVVKAQSQARGELLPAAGPAKIETVANATSDTEELAADFELDLNLALVKGMPEYVPDMDRALFGFFYGGNCFRYGFHDPLLGRPSVQTVGVEDLIVSEEATSLETAVRWTMRIPQVSPAEVKRRQFYGQWRDIDLSPAAMPVTDAALQGKLGIAGLTNLADRPKDQPYTIYHTVTNLDLAPYGLREKGAPRGLPLPYRITIEKNSKEILRIERFWRPGDPRFQRKRRCIHYCMVPGFGFLGYGFLHLQGNSVSTLTAIVRLLVDAMMFGTFPGGVKQKGVRTETNEIEPAPGEWVELGVPGGIDDIRKVIMALPYKDLSPVAIQLYQIVQQACARVGAAAMLEVGEGRANVPVGTIMAMLEEKSVVMAAVHKRLHEAMGQELTMIRELFAERPETLAQVVPNPRRQWATLQEVMNMDLVPASDPNVPSQVHRVMMATALATLMSMPALQGKLDIDDGLKRVLRMIGITDADNLVVPSQPGAQPDPSAQMVQAQLMAKREDSQRKAATEVVRSQQQERDSQRKAQVQWEKNQADTRVALIREETERMRMQQEAQQQQKEAEQDAMNAHLDRQMQAEQHQQNMEQMAQQRAQQHEQHQDAMQQKAADRQMATQRNFGGQGL